MHELLIATFFVLIGTVIAVPLLAPVAEQLRLIDHPGGRKDHARAVPLTGGIAMVLPLMPMQLILAPQPTQVLPFIVAAVAMMAIGLYDDRHPLSATRRILLQILLAVFAVVVGGLAIPSLGTGPSGDALELGWFTIPFTILCLVGLINAINMTDGLDGLAGGHMLAMLASLVALAVLAGLGDALDVALPLLTMAAVLGFLVWNFPVVGRRSAHVFMGDAGSMTLGLILGWIAIDLSTRLQLSPMIIAWILAVPVLDTVTVIIRRLVHGHHPFRPDREHLHHLLLDHGFSRPMTTMALILLSIMSGLFAIASWAAEIPDWWLLSGFVAAGILNLALSETLATRRDRQPEPTARQGD